jgi:hypothetical protein
MTRDRLSLTPNAITFIALAAALNLLLYHRPLFSFAVGNLDLSSFTGELTLARSPCILWSPITPCWTRR